MKNTGRFSRSLGQLAFSLGILLLAVHSIAQTTEVQIMVSGSWDYVEDPNPKNDPNSSGQGLDRIVLVAPQTPSHGAFIFSGDNATKFPQKDVHGNFILPPLAKTGIYYLDINNLVQNSGHAPTASDLQPLNYINVQPVKIKTIETVLYKFNAGMPRFAVSLPVPDYYSTYNGPWLKGNGFSESKVDTKPITPQTPDGYYTTWMVLHYWVNGVGGVVPSANLTAILDDQSSYSTTKYSFTSDAGSQAPIGISVVMGAVYGQNDISCDSFSQQSFDHATALWGLTLYASFPAEDLNGIQYPGAYHYGCPARHGEAGGSADCHKAQISINGAVQ